MDVRQLKEYIVENCHIETILTDIQCHHIKYHSSGCYWTCANKTGDNPQAIVVKTNENLSCDNYTRKMVKSDRPTDLIDLVCYNLEINFPEALKKISEMVGIDYYYDFSEDIPESLMITDLIFNMREDIETNEDKPLKPIPNTVLSYYHNYVNDLFYNDGISYETQREFNIGYDDETNRITIPIYSEIGDLVGIKGRLFKKELDKDDLKYLYLKSCARSRVLYGLNMTMPYIKTSQKVFVVESEKGVMQLWSYGYKNVVGTGGKQLSHTQIEMLTRLGVDIIFVFDKDVTEEELENISNRFIDNIPIWYIYDKNNILSEKESPSDNSNKWELLLKNSLYRMR